MTADTETVIESGTEIFVALNKLKKSPKNARKTPHGEAAVEALAASIEAKGMLQNLVVEPERDAKGAETGYYFVTIGEGRRLAQLLRAKRRQIKKTEPIRCVIDTANDPHEISLDENITRTGMHPADQFEAFKCLIDERGLGVEEIAARFGVTSLVVRQRLRLAAVSPVLIQVYRDGDISLDQLMAFTATEDQERQMEVWEGLSWNKEPAIIRRALNEGRVSARDRRAVFVGAEAYQAAGGVIERDLFAADQGGHLADPALLDRLTLAKLREVAEEIQAEGWRWVSAVIDLPLAHGCRRIYPKAQSLTSEDQARLAELSLAYDIIQAEHEGDAEFPEAVATELAALTADIAVLTEQQTAFDPGEVQRAGAFITLAHDGAVQIHRGYVRPEDEAVVETDDSVAGAQNDDGRAVGAVQDGEDGPSPLSDRLIADLTAHRTAALRDGIAKRPDIAFIAVVHALALQTFYHGHDLGSCLELNATSTNLGVHASGIENGPAGSKIDERHAAWAGRMPGDAADLWSLLFHMTGQDRNALLAHCASLCVNAVRLYEGRPQALRHADHLAQAVGLDMTAYWTPTVESYFGRVTKAHMLAAVREAASTDEARQIEGMKKAAMAEAAGERVVGTGWLPSLLRPPVIYAPVDAAAAKAAE